MGIEIEDAIMDVNTPPYTPKHMSEDGELLGLLVVDDKTIAHCMNNDNGRELIDYIEDLQEFTGATNLKITIEAFK